MAIALPSSIAPARLGLLAILLAGTGCPDDPDVTPTTDGDTDTDTTTGDVPPVTTIDPDTTVGMDTTDGTTEGETTEDETTEGETTEGAVCGNGRTENGEACDGEDLGGEDCESQGFGGGTLTCADDCTFDTSECAKLACGNDTVDKGEVCDGTDLGGEDCESQGFAGGTLACAGDCLGFDTTSCTEAPAQDCCQPQMGLTGCSDAACEAAVCAADDYCCLTEWDAACVDLALAEAACAGVGTCPAPGVCGDGVLGFGEVCDGVELGGEDCESQGFTGGTLACLGDCTGFDTTSCTTPPPGLDCCEPQVGLVGCPDAACEAAVCAADDYCCLTEWDSVCVGLALDEAACAGATSCPPVGVCGDGGISFGETCDGADLGGQDCVSLGFTGGTLACQGDCTGFDTTSCTQDCCTSQTGLTGCSDAACEAAVCAVDDYCCLTEWDQICANLALEEVICAGTGECPPVGVCGDGGISFGETCDGADLGGQDCVSQGFTGGTLACQGDCTGFDTTSCTQDCCTSQTGLTGCSDAACEAAVCAVDDYCCLTEWDQVCANLALEEIICAGTGECPPVGVCGDGAISFGETCDGADLDGLDCVQFGYASGGALTCAADCSVFDTGACIADLTCSDQDLGSATGAAVAMGTTVGADNDIDASCGGTGGPDQVFTFTAATSGVYTFDTLGSAFDTKLAMFLECVPTSEIVCNDDQEAGVVFQSEIVVNVPAGQVVLLVVDGYDGETGNWVLNITGP